MLSTFSRELGGEYPSGSVVGFASDSQAGAYIRSQFSST